MSSLVHTCSRNWAWRNPENARDVATDEIRLLDSRSQRENQFEDDDDENEDDIEPPTANRQRLTVQRFGRGGRL
jgi:hypothetical protein